MGVELTYVHWFYLLFTVLVVISMVYRLDTAILCTVGIFLLGLLATGSFIDSITAIFQTFLYTANQLFSIILVIAIIVGMSQVLQKSGVNAMMVAPFTSIIRTPMLAFWVIGIVIMIFSWFFWPSPAVALLGVFFLPVASKVGLPPLATAISMNLFGHGIALSGDYVIQGSPKITADSANVPVGDILTASVPFVISMGVVSVLLAYYFIRRDLRNGSLTMETGLKVVSNTELDEVKADEKQLSRKAKMILAGLVLLAFAGNIAAMFLFELQGDEATALIGGTSMLVLALISIVSNPKEGLKNTIQTVTSGFAFAFRVFAPVIPIASFFYLGGDLFFEMFGKNLPLTSKGIVYDLGIGLTNLVAVTPQIGALVVSGIGVVAALDGSGYSGIALIGAIAPIFAGAIDHGVATLASLGQVISLWVGGGTIVPWALLPAAAIAGVDPIEVARRNLVPVLVGIVVTTILAMFLL
ncbi:membrane protein [Risungbinella massiliensis]|uniref:membrane protein n=1 Tax=Risungbinella massiliensis TaxID=1329796 RepID=UPI0005CBBE2F|nr:membrane protein [Risungbinella massiliensis]